MVQEFVAIFPVERSTSDVSALLLRYFYHCFNSNVDNLLTLFENESVANADAFEASSEDITIINDFITWENPKKNTLVYSIIATCYEYCMLTIKKDNILSAELFKGKRFYLDANIIFRMAGINNEERKTVTQGFIDHCFQAGIELYCTSTTVDEVYRVVSSQVAYIRGIAGQSKPVSCDKLEAINPNTEVNDFYRLYYDWCREPGNVCGDYTSFSGYLLQLVQETLSKLKIKESSSYKLGSYSTQYAQRVAHLRDYKNRKRTWRHTSTASAETDITNIMDTLSWRAGTGNSIWQTNDFIVSADQLLIGWSNDVYSGVPIVVLPSVWLSIILRFTGRTDDDYKSFCLFLTQRHHINAEEIIDPIQLLRAINGKTNQTEVKERIIAEITQNKATYTFKTVEDYSENTERAFDKVLEEVYGKTAQQVNDAKEEMRKQLEALEQSSADKAAETAAIYAAAERDKTVVLLSKKQAFNVVSKFRDLHKWICLIYLLGGVGILFGTAIWLFELSPMYDISISLLPTKLMDNIDRAWTIISMAIGLVAVGVGKFFSYLGSEEREQKMYAKYYKENSEAVQ